MKAILFTVISLALFGCQTEVVAPNPAGFSPEVLAAQNAYYASLPAAPAGYRLPLAGEVIPEIVMRGMPEGGPGWSFLIKGSCYYYRYNEGEAEMIYPAPDRVGMNWNDQDSRAYCVNE